MKFKDLAPGAIFKIAEGQRPDLFGTTWVKDEEEEHVPANAHAVDNEHHRAYVNPNVEVIVEE